ncbi:MAG: radical SAM protein [Candidatus Omnitrophica bacterium]|nr:radical SAM protein [Candidatus Omnitrophota bacterium]
MRLSHHTIVVKDYPSKGEHLLYSTRTQALVKIEDALRLLLDRLPSAGPADTVPYQQEIKQLHDMGLIVTGDAEEQSRLREHLNQIKFSHDESCLPVTILTTYGCNFKCTYCFEESTRTNDRLSAEHQQKIIRWLKDRVRTLGYRSLYLNYYGGEPLLNQPAIEQISTEMRRWCRESGVGFGMALQTNGYLLTPQVVRKFLELNLVGVRVSLDGVGEDHDRYRPLRGGGGTFTRIMRNIVDCVDLVPIGISIGFDKGDVEPIEKLVNHFEELGILHKLGRIITSPITPTVGPAGRPEAVRGSECMCHSQDATLAAAMRRINALFEAKGINKVKSGMATNVCPLTRENGGVTIDQEGRLYKCNSLLGHPEFSVGHVDDAQYNETGRRFRDLDVWRQCPIDCTYLPMCSGGCRLMAFVGESKSFRVAACKKPYLNEMAAEFIKRDYDRLTAKQKAAV